MPLSSVLCPRQRYPTLVCGTTLPRHTHTHTWPRPHQRNLLWVQVESMRAVMRQIRETPDTDQSDQDRVCLPHQCLATAARDLSRLRGDVSQPFAHEQTHEQTRPPLAHFACHAVWLDTPALTPSHARVVWLGCSHNSRGRILPRHAATQHNTGEARGAAAGVQRAAARGGRQGGARARRRSGRAAHHGGDLPRGSATGRQAFRGAAAGGFAPAKHSRRDLLQPRPGAACIPVPPHPATCSPPRSVARCAASYRRLSALVSSAPVSPAYTHHLFTLPASRVVCRCTRAAGRAAREARHRPRARRRRRRPLAKGAGHRQGVSGPRALLSDVRRLRL